MHTPSTIAVSAAVVQIARSGGSQADPDMLNMAGDALFAGCKYFNGRQDWYWLRTEGNPIAVTGPFAFALTASAGQTTAALAASHGLQPDDFLVGSGFQVGTRVVTTATTSATFSRAFSLSAGAQSYSATANRDLYDLPTDFRKPYTIKLLSQRKTLIPAQRRAYDRSTYDEFTPGSPDWYDLFANFQKGKIRLLPPPATADTLFMRYQRRITVATSSADATVLDIPQDYDAYLIAWGKWAFLTDKGQPERAATWLTLANEGLKLMVADQTNQPDESLAFGDRSPQSWGDVTSTRSVNWDYT